MGQSRLWVELNQLRLVSSTEAGAGQPDGTVIADVVDVAEAVELVATLVVGCEVVVGATEVVLEVMLDVLADVLLELEALEDVVAVVLDDVVLTALEVVVLTELAEVDNKLELEAAVVEDTDTQALS